MMLDTAGLEGDALDWAVVYALVLPANNGRVIQAQDLASIAVRNGVGFTLDSIIDADAIATRRHGSGTWYAVRSDDLGDAESPSWSKMTVKGAEQVGRFSYDVRLRQQRFEGASRREAVLRCFVASKFGEKVHVPDPIVTGERNLVPNTRPGVVETRSVDAEDPEDQAAAEGQAEQRPRHRG